MTSFQRNNNVLVAIRRESSFNVQATATGATEIRLTDSPGLSLKRAQIVSSEKRTDLLKTMPRMGYKSVAGSYNSELTVGGHIDLGQEAVTRGVWATATSITFATMTSVQLLTNAVVATGGSWITQGIKVGDIFQITGTTVSADNNLNVRALSVATLTIGVATGTFTTLASTATGTLTVLKKLATPTTPTSYSHSVEQYDGDTDLSELFTGVRWVGRKYSFKPGSPATVVDTFMGADRTALTTGTSPYFTSPSVTTGLALITEDSTLRYNGAIAATFTGFDLDFQVSAKGEPVIGTFVTPNVFDDDCTVTASITGLRSDFSNLTLYDAETEFDLSIKLEEPNTGPPKSCFSIFLPRVKIGDLSANAGGGDGAKIETLQILVGPKVATSVYDAGVATFHSTAP